MFIIDFSFYRLPTFVLRQDFVSHILALIKRKHDRFVRCLPPVVIYTLQKHTTESLAFDTSPTSSFGIIFNAYKENI